MTVLRERANWHKFTAAETIAPEILLLCIAIRKNLRDLRKFFPVRQAGRVIEVKSPFAPFVPFCGHCPLVAAPPRRVSAFRFSSPILGSVLLEANFPKLSPDLSSREVWGELRVRAL